MSNEGQALKSAFSSFSALNFIYTRVFEPVVVSVMNWNHPMAMHSNYIESFSISPSSSSLSLSFLLSFKVYFSLRGIICHIWWAFRFDYRCLRWSARTARLRERNTWSKTHMDQMQRWEFEIIRSSQNVSFVVLGKITSIKSHMGSRSVFKSNIAPLHLLHI